MGVAIKGERKSRFLGTSTSAAYLSLWRVLASFFNRYSIRHLITPTSDSLAFDMWNINSSFFLRISMRKGRDHLFSNDACPVLCSECTVVWPLDDLLNFDLKQAFLRHWCILPSLFPLNFSPRMYLRKGFYYIRCWVSPTWWLLHL